MNIDAKILNTSKGSYAITKGFIPELQRWLKIWKLINVICHIMRIKDKNCMIGNGQDGRGNGQVAE